ncbi:HTH-type transcriptional regulator MalT [compost metagenome]
MPTARNETSLPSAPPLPAGFLPRPRLSAALLAARSRLRLICAPAGSGKSFLLRECAQACPDDTRLYWLDLRGQPLGDGEFLQLLAATLGLDRSDLGSIQGHLMRQTSPIWLMLDDLPRFPDERLDACLDRLLQMSPPCVSWWIASRRRPACKLERLLLEGDLFELGMADLALNPAELGELLDSLGCDAQGPMIDMLMVQTAGWYAGVRLRLHGLEPGQPLESARGSQLVRSYLEREVLEELPGDLRQALGTLACLREFDASLCEHLLGMGEGAQLLRRLQECGAFIETLDSDAGVYRVHPAIAPVLAADIAEGPRRALYRHACQWAAGREQVREAIDYALLADQLEVAASLLQHFTRDRLLQGRHLACVLEWRNELPDELLASTPRLLILNAWALIISGRLDEAELCARQLQRFLPQPNARRQRELLAQCQALVGKLEYHRGRVNAPHMAEAAAHLAEAAWAQRVLLLTALIELELAEGRVESAEALNHDAVKLARKHRSRVLEGVLLLQRVHLLEIRGELKAALSLIEQLHAELNAEWKGEATPLRGRVQLRRAAILVRMGQYAQARELYQAGLQECLDCEDPAACWGYIGLAELDAAENALPQANTRLIDGERLLQFRNITEPLYQSLLVLGHARLWLQEGQVERARSVLEECLAQFSGPDERKPPYGSPELVQRLRLALAQVRLAAGENVIEPLEAMLREALAEGRQVLACELWFVLAEACYAEGQQGRAQRALLDGMALSRRIGLVSAEQFCALRNPGLVRWGKETLCAEGQSPVAVLLSRRELSVLEMIAQGLSNHEIAERLFISLHTVKSHAQRINAKLGVERRTQAIVRAKELGLVK